MKLFGSSPQEQAMQRLVHDTNSELDRFRFYIKKMDEFLKENGKKITEAGITNSTPWVCNEYFRSVHEEFKKSIDLYYQGFAADFQLDQSDPSVESKNKDALEKEVIWLRKRLREQPAKYNSLIGYYRDELKKLRPSKPI